LPSTTSTRYHSSAEKRYLLPVPPKYAFRSRTPDDLAVE